MAGKRLRAGQRTNALLMQAAGQESLALTMLLVPLSDPIGHALPACARAGEARAGGPAFGDLQLLRLDSGGFDDPGSAFALAQHKPREVGLRHAHRFATVFHQRGAHAGI